MNEQKNFKTKLSKIVCTLCEYYSELNNMCSYFNSHEDCLMFNKITEALLLSGIGDVNELQKECDSKEEAYNKCYSDYKYWKDKAKEYKHKAEVAERALKIICRNIRIDSGDNEDEIKANSDILYKAYLKQAKKELQKENEQM